MDALVENVAQALINKGMYVCTAESCTGGLIAMSLTERSGSSAYFERGLVTYSNEAKTELLDVDPSLIEKHGAVSAEVARAMAEGAIKNSQADIAVSVTGIAGPTGGSPEKPVGLVYIGVALKDKPARVIHNQFEGSRQSVRLQSCEKALRLILETLDTL